MVFLGTFTLTIGIVSGSEVTNQEDCQLILTGCGWTSLHGHLNIGQLENQMLRVKDTKTVWNFIPIVFNADLEDMKRNRNVVVTGMTGNVIPSGALYVASIGQHRD